MDMQWRYVKPVKSWENKLQDWFTIPILLSLAAVKNSKSTKPSMAPYCSQHKFQTLRLSIQGTLQCGCRSPFQCYFPCTVSSLGKMHHSLLPTHMSWCFPAHMHLSTLLPWTTFYVYVICLCIWYSAQPCKWERGGEVEMYGKNNMETYITICKIDSQWEFAVWLRKVKQGHCTNLEG